MPRRKIWTSRYFERNLSKLSFWTVQSIFCIRHNVKNIWCNAIFISCPTTGRGCYNILWYHVKISVLPRLSEQLYISSDWLVEVVWSRHCFILERKVQFYPSNFLDCTNFQPQIRIMKSTAPFSIQQTFFWQHNSLLALLWGECPVNLCPAFDAFLSSIYLYIHCFQNNKNQYPNVYDWLILSGCL